MRTADLVSQYPEIYHMAEDGSWPNIREHGLLSISALLDKWEYSGLAREEIECKHRPNKVCIHHKKYGTAVVRDQKALHPERLKKCLPKDITVEDWCKFINKRVFFWADWIGLKILLSANAYIYKPHLVITVNTRALLQRYESEVALSPINTGSTYARKGKADPEPRSFATFQRIPEYTYHWVNELAVDYGIPDVVSFAISVARYRANRRGYENEPEKLEEVWHQ
jgi:hypothetical protein